MALLHRSIQQQHEKKNLDINAARRICAITLLLFPIAALLCANNFFVHNSKLCFCLESYDFIYTVKWNKATQPKRLRVDRHCAYSHTQATGANICKAAEAKNKIKFYSFSAKYFSISYIIHAKNRQILHNIKQIETDFERREVFFLWNILISFIRILIIEIASIRPLF